LGGYGLLQKEERKEVIHKVVFIGNTIGCGGKFIREVLSHNQDVSVAVNAIDFDNLLKTPNPIVYHYYNIEAIHTRLIKNIKEQILFVYPVRDFFEHYYYLRTKYKRNIDGQIYIQMLLASKRALDILHEQENITVKYMTIFKKPDKVLHELGVLLRSYLGVNITKEQLDFIGKQSNHEELKNFEYYDTYKLELIRYREYPEAFDWYNDLYLDATMGI
jgi:hypothetical protein